jgi:glycosyltransferase involved in cell wall biosynthesis
MSAVPLGSAALADPATGRPGGRAEPDPRPLVSIVVPAYNEAAVAVQNLTALCRYMEALEAEYRWELIVINDGSTDETGALLEAFAASRDRVQVLHHRTNAGIGQAFQLAFEHCRGDYVITVDLDLTYAPHHIRALLDRIRTTGAQVVVASPYMAGGRISNVPRLRRTLSVWANRFLAFAARGNLSTLTGIVRAYDGRFLRTLDLKGRGMEVNPEIIYKAMLLGARVEEIPGHLDWGTQHAERARSRARLNMRLVRHVMAVLLSGFLFRPVIFFIVPGLALLGFSLFANAWAFIHFLEHYAALTQYATFGKRASAATAAAFQQAPHTFVVGGIAGMLGIQLVSLGILALQSKSYFEEIFHLGTAVYRQLREGRSAPKRPDP